jgi:hypothetical protein
MLHVCTCVHTWIRLVIAFYLVLPKYIRVIHKVTLSSFTLSLGLLSPLPPLSVVSAKYRHFIKSQYEMLQLNMKCWNSAFNARGSRLIIVVVQLGAVKIYVAAVEALRKKERQDKYKIISRFLTRFTTKNWWFSEFHTPLSAIVLFCKFFLLYW